MAANSKIEWTDATWNPVTGCTPIGAGCVHCYAARMSYRLENMGQSKYAGLTSLKVNGARHFNGVVRCHEDVLGLPLRWRKPRRIFVCSMSDLYHPDVPDAFLDKVHAVMTLCRQHTFIDLTKRSERRRQYLTEPFVSYRIADQMSTVAPNRGAWYWPTFDVAMAKVWRGVSVSTQAELDAAVSYLLKTSAAVRLLSLEPLLESVRLHCPGCHCCFTSEGGVLRDGKVCMNEFEVDGVIVGCESGPNRRPCKIEWIESIVAQCQAAGIKCFVKQVSINGRVSHDMSEWPESIRVRELPG